jgi:hypothetical protein
MIERTKTIEEQEKRKTLKSFGKFFLKIDLIDKAKLEVIAILKK